MGLFMRVGIWQIFAAIITLGCFILSVLSTEICEVCKAILYLGHEDWMRYMALLATIAYSGSAAAGIQWGLRQNRLLKDPSTFHGSSTTLTRVRLAFIITNGFSLLFSLLLLSVSGYSANELSNFWTGTVFDGVVLLPITVSFWLLAPLFLNVIQAAVAVVNIVLTIVSLVVLFKGTEITPTLDDPGTFPFPTGQIPMQVWNPDQSFPVAPPSLPLPDAPVDRVHEQLVMSNFHMVAAPIPVNRTTNHVSETGHGEPILDARQDSDPELDRESYLPSEVRQPSRNEHSRQRRPRQREKRSDKHDRRGRDSDRHFDFEFEFDRDRSSPTFDRPRREQDVTRRTRSEDVRVRQSTGHHHSANVHVPTATHWVGQGSDHHHPVNAHVPTATHRIRTNYVLDELENFHHKRRSMETGRRGRGDRLSDEEDPRRGSRRPYSHEERSGREDRRRRVEEPEVVRERPRERPQQQRRYHDEFEGPQGRPTGRQPTGEPEFLRGRPRDEEHRRYPNHFNERKIEQQMRPINRPQIVEDQRRQNPRRDYPDDEEPVQRRDNSRFRQQEVRQSRVSAFPSGRRESDW